MVPDRRSELTKPARRPSHALQASEVRPQHLSCGKKPNFADSSQSSVPHFPNVHRVSDTLPQNIDRGVRQKIHRSTKKSASWL